MQTVGPQPIFVPASEGKVLDFISVTHKLMGAQTGEGHYAFESTFEPGAGSRLHVHSREAEFGYVLEGALEFRLPDRAVVIEAGGLAHLPLGVPRALRNQGSTPSRYLFMAVPAGLDRWFDELAAARESGTLDEALHRRLALKYGIEFLE